MFYNGWQSLLQTLVVGTLAYIGLVIVLRASGKRTLSKMNAFDFVVTVALGSTLATVITSPQVALAQGLVALALLVGLQFVVARLAVSWPWFSRLIRSRPRLLLLRGECQQAAMHRERITESELLSAIRQAGGTHLQNTYAVVLEADGTLSVISHTPHPPAASTLQDVAGAQDQTG